MSAPHDFACSLCRWPRCCRQGSETITLEEPGALETGSYMDHWHIVGDSHVSAFRNASHRGLIDYPCKITDVGGATAVGLRNPNSLTDAIGHFKKALLPPAVGTIPVIQIGEVDCGFVIWYRSARYNESVAIQLEQAVAAYFAFVNTLIASGHNAIVISGATLPTIMDGQDWSEIANARREVTATLVQRTDLTLLYNEKLRVGAEVRGLPFIDIAHYVLDTKTHTISDFFRHPDLADHHLDPDKAGALWATELNRVSGHYSRQS